MTNKDIFKVLPGYGEDQRSQQDQSNKIGNRHKRIQRIRYQPDHIQLNDRTNRNSNHQYLSDSH